MAAVGTAITSGGGDTDHPLHAVITFRSLLPAFDAALSARFRLLKAHESGLPLNDFLAAAAANDQPRAALVSGGFRFTADLLDRLPSLRCVATTSAGLDHIDLEECARRGVVVANAGEVFTTDVADYAVGLLIDVLRGISAGHRLVRRGLRHVDGSYPAVGSKLRGKRVGIVGLGSIGSAIAKRLDAFGCAISYNSRRSKPSVPYQFFPDVGSLAAECDVLILSCALTEATYHIVDKSVMRALGKDGVIINVGRGKLIDEVELVRALQQGVIGGAGLDVFENEPFVPPELFSMDNVVIVGHLAVFTGESLSAVYDLMIANLEAFFAGKPLISPV